MQVFRRQNFDQLWITLQSNESLGLLDSSYLKDYFGNEHQVTLFNLETQVRIPVPMTELIGEEDPTPELPHDVFSGFIDLVEIPNGNYKIEGLVRDVSGNYTILSEIENPSGSERIMSFEIRVTVDQISVSFPGAKINMGITFSAELPAIMFPVDAKIEKLLNIASQIDKVSIFPATIVEYLTVETSLSKGFSFSTSITKTVEVEASMGF